MTSRRKTTADSEYSLAMRVARMDPQQRREALSNYSDSELDLLKYSWDFWARPKQKEPQGDWRVWLALCGRGFGKTRLGAEWIRKRVESGRANRIALVGRTAADVRKTMVEGKSGILNVFPPGTRPVYKPSLREVYFVDQYGDRVATAITYSADEPDLLRGPEHDTAWADELAAWRFPDAWDQLNLGLRIGEDPRCVVTTTPRPSRIIRGLIKDPNTYVTRGSTYENTSNVARAWLQTILHKYEGTTIGRQELEAEVLDEMPGALWTRLLVNETRIEVPEVSVPSWDWWYSQYSLPKLDEIVVSVDPAVTAEEGSDHTGIIVAGANFETNHSYILEDLTGLYTPGEWGAIACEAYDRWKADCITAEVNNGGDLVESNILGERRDIAYVGVHAKKGKYSRAQPIAASYERRTVHHAGTFPDLEDEMCTFVPGVSSKSPNRMDAAVYAITYLTRNYTQVYLPSGGDEYQQTPWNPTP